MNIFKKDGIVCQNTGLFLVRLGVGLPFIVHGWQKFSSVEMTVGFFAGLGIPAFITYLIIAVELLGGIAMILGVWTKWAGWLLAIIMAGAIILVTGKNGFTGYEFNITLLLASLGIAFAGPGTYTVHKLFGGNRE